MADKPVTREEKYLAYLTGDYTGEIPKPIMRKEKYLHELCLKEMGGLNESQVRAIVTSYGYTSVTDSYINSLIDAKLGVIENGTY